MNGLFYALDHWHFADVDVETKLDYSKIYVAGHNGLAGRAIVSALSKQHVRILLP